MVSQFLAVCSWVGIALFMWSVSDSLAKIAAGMHRDSRESAAQYLGTSQNESP